MSERIWLRIYRGGEYDYEFVKCIIGLITGIVCSLYVLCAFIALENWGYYWGVLRFDRSDEIGAISAVAALVIFAVWLYIRYIRMTMSAVLLTLLVLLVLPLSSFCHNQWQIRFQPDVDTIILTHLLITLGFTIGFFVWVKKSNNLIQKTLNTPIYLIVLIGGASWMWIPNIVHSYYRLFQ